jgi:hypothetical protein
MKGVESFEVFEEGKGKAEELLKLRLNPVKHLKGPDRSSLNIFIMKVRIIMDKVSLEELYPHLFMNDPKSIVSSMLKVDQEAARIRAKARGEDFKDLTIEEKRAIAFQCIEDNKKQEKERQKLDHARNNQKKILREYDPRVAIEERHLKINEKRQERIKNQAEERLEQLRVERQRLVEEISPGEMEKIKSEIRKTAEEAKRQDFMQKKQIRDLQEMEKVARNQEILRQEMEKKQRELQEFRAQKFIKTLRSFKQSKERHFLFFSFTKINTFSITLKSKSLKIMRKSRFKKLFQAFNFWKTASMKAKLEEEAAVFQAEQERMHYLLQLGQKHYEFTLKRKALESFAKFLYVARREKREAKEIQARREKFENFMNFVRIRTEEETQRKQAEEQNLKKLAEIEKKSKKDLKTFQEKPSLEKSQKNNQLHFEEPVFFRENRNKNISSPPAMSLDLEISSQIEKSSSPSSKIPQKTASKQDACTFIDLPSNEPDPPKDPVKTQPSEKQGQTPEVLKKTPKPSKEVLRMQQRQEERKLKREALEAKYKEKKEKEEQAKRESEQKALEEEKKKKKDALEKRKQAEKAKKELEDKKKKDLEDQQIKTEIAEDHRQVFLLKFHLQKWQEFHYNWQRSLIKSEVFHDRAIKSHIFQLFKQAVQISKAASLHLEAIREERSFNHYLFMLKKRKFIKWQDFLNNKRQLYLQAFKVREKFLKMKVFEKWNDLIPELLDERYEREKEENFKVHRFRLVVIAPKVLKAWKEFVEEQKEEKLKEQFASAMWEKAQEWLSQAQE